MTLSCSCSEFDRDYGSWCYYPPEYFTVFKEYRRKRCSSCNELIDIGADCLDFYRTRAPYTEIEENIMGEDIEMASLYFCESCGEIYLNLSSIGYCFSPTDNMQDHLKEYWALTGFTPEKS